MFIQSKYYNWYCQIIEKAKNRETSGYVERHHIVPKSMGGDNSLANLVKLTAREHYICHKLLIRITDGNHKKKMLLALWSFNRSSGNQNRTTVSGRDYESIRTQVAAMLSTTRKGVMNVGKKDSPESNAKRSAALKGRAKSDETKKRMQDSWQSRGPRSDTHKEALRNSAIGRAHSDETKAKMSQAKKGVSPIHTQVPYTCPHCNKSGVGISNYNRWHGNNCKELTYGK